MRLPTAAGNGLLAVLFEFVPELPGFIAVFVEGGADLRRELIGIGKGGIEDGDGFFCFPGSGEEGTGGERHLHAGDLEVRVFRLKGGEERAGFEGVLSQQVPRSIQ